MNFGKNLKQLREKHGVTQSEVAIHVDVTAQAVSKWEKELATPDLYVLVKLAEYFGVSPNKLLVGCSSDANKAQKERDREFFYYCSKNMFDDAKIMWAAGGIDLSYSYAGNTALIYAAYRNHIEMVQWLVSINAPLNDLNMDGKTALHRACYGGYAEIVQILLSAGADTTICDKHGLTACDYAEENKRDEITKMLNLSTGH